MSERKEKLELLGAILLSCLQSDSIKSDEIKELLDDAAEEMDSKLSNEQYRLWEENDCRNLTFSSGMHSKENKDE